MKHADPECDECGGEGIVRTQAQVYPHEPHTADIGEQDCICTLDEL